MQSNLRFYVIVEGLAILRFLRLVLFLIKNSIDFRGFFLIVLVKVAIVD